ncbi:MAG TPA: thioesterase family protein [Pirellulales bacterium]|nr:thioesterase family protein [Pirellulales bacterium]
MPAPFCTTRRVEFHHTDAAGIVHFSQFFLFMEEVEHEFLRSRGLSVMMRDEQGVVSWPRVAARCQYRSTVKFEDLIEIELQIDRLGEKSVGFGFRFTHQGREVADGEITAVCCRIEPDGTPRSIAIPAGVREKLCLDP